MADLLLLEAPAGSGLDMQNHTDAAIAAIALDGNINGMLTGVRQHPPILIAGTV